MPQVDGRAACSTPSRHPVNPPHNYHRDYVLALSDRNMTIRWRSALDEHNLISSIIQGAFSFQQQVIPLQYINAVSEN